MKRRLRRGVQAALLLWVGLASAPAHAVLEGVNTTGFGAVVGIKFPGMEGATGCTGLVIHPRVVLTSARCLTTAIAQGKVAQGSIFVGFQEGAADNTIISVVDARVHRLYRTGKDESDLGVVLLAQDVPATVTPAVLNETPLPASLVNGQVKVVGFGANKVEPDTPADEDTDPQYVGTGRKRTANTRVAALSFELMYAGDDKGNACRGDTGAPVYATIDGHDVVVAITGNTELCSVASVKTNVNAALADFIWPAVDAWVGACAKDGMCTTTGCRTPDPDCDPCGLDGTCAVDCPAPDGDCPAGGRYRDACAEDKDCDSRSCVSAVDDARIKFCSHPCEAAQTVFYCGESMQCVDAGGASACVYEAPTPGAQGSPCMSGSECRSGLCNPDRLCVEECDPNGAACPDGFVCRPSELAPYICAPPRNAPSGFCQVGGLGAAGGWAGSGALLAGLALLWRRRRG